MKKINNIFKLFIGDIFYQCITHCEDTENLPLINTHAYYALESWEHEILQQNRDIIPLVLTDQVNMKHVFDGNNLKYTSSMSIMMNN